MAVIAAVMMCGSPLLLSMVAVWSLGLISDTDSGCIRICLVLGIVQLLAAGAVGILYRWCFARPPVRGAALFASLLGSLLLVSDPLLLAALSSSINQQESLSSSALFAGLFALRGAMLLSITCVVCMIIVATIELPVRWAQAGRELLSDGTLRVFRSLVLLLVLLLGATSVQREGLSGLIELIMLALA